MTMVHIQGLSRGIGLKLFHLVINSREKDIKNHDYEQKLIDYFKLVVVNTPPKLTDQEKRSIATSFGYSYQDQSIENNSKRILTHLLKR